ncbi:hypothetical protein ACS0TY_025714 [Phlomoides rotata]
MSLLTFTAITFLFGGYCTLKKIDELESKGEDLNVTYYNILMDALCRAGKLHAAEAMFNELHSRGLEPDVVTYYVLINGCY